MAAASKPACPGRRATPKDDGERSAVAAGSKDPQSLPAVRPFLPRHEPARRRHGRDLWPSVQGREREVEELHAGEIAAQDQGFRRRYCPYHGRAGPCRCRRGGKRTAPAEGPAGTAGLPLAFPAPRNGETRTMRGLRETMGGTQVSLTDPDARVTAKTARHPRIVGYNVQIGYNVQSGVDAEHHLMVVRELTMRGSDRDALPEMAIAAQEVMTASDLRASSVSMPARRGRPDPNSDGPLLSLVPRGCRCGLSRTPFDATCLSLDLSAARFAPQGGFPRDARDSVRRRGVGGPTFVEVRA